MPEAFQASLVIRNIAVATDFSPWSDRAMQHAFAIARRFGAVLHIVHAVRRSEFAFAPELMVPIHDLAERDCENMMGLLHAAHSLDGLEHRCWNLDGECSEVFGEFVRDRKIDLLVLGTRARTGISKFLLGSIAEEIAGCVPCPVLAIGPSAREATRNLQVKRVLFATDLSGDASAAIPYVLTAANAWEAQIDILPLCVPDASRLQQAMEAVNRKLELLVAGIRGVSVHSFLQAAAPLTAVLDCARQNKEDLIVFGLDHRLSAHQGAPPPHADEIVRQARCPVLSVRSQAR